VNIINWLGLTLSLIAAGTIVYPIVFKLSSEVLANCVGGACYLMMWAIVLLGLRVKKM
jgi:hypothetical protein